MGRDHRLGALLLARSREPFGMADLQLLETAEDQIDSAIVQGYVYYRTELFEKQVRLKQREIDLIMAIDEIRDSAPEPGAMLRSITTLLANWFEAELCLLYLLDREAHVVELKAVNDGGETREALQGAISEHLAARAVQLDRIMTWDAREALPPDVRGSEPLYLAATPIIMGKDHRLGALLLAREGSPFAAPDVQLLETAEDQIDSTVIQGYIYYKRQLSKKELEVIYQVDRIRDTGLSLEDMLETVLSKICESIDTEMGFFMRYRQRDAQLEMQATTDKTLDRRSAFYKTLEALANQALQRAELLCVSHRDNEECSVMCLPLILNNYIIGVLGVANRERPRNFSGADRRLLRAIGSQIDTAIYEGIEKHHLRTLLSRSVGTRVMEQLLARPNVDLLRGERKELTVLYADVRGSTDLAENTEPELLVEFINDFLSQMTDVILRHEGTLDKFVGDMVMALFGAPVGQTDHALRAVRVALEMQDLHQLIMKYWRGRGVDARPIGIGIATGDLTVGEMGGPQRTNYTVIGRAANLGSRICAIAQADQILISQSTYDRIKAAVEVIPLPGQQFKGVAEDVTVYQVVRLK
jgi:class 3 adenylate cyclase/GAF domain-containing protein